MKKILIFGLLLVLAAPVMGQDLDGDDWIEMTQREKELYVEGALVGASVLHQILMEAGILFAPIKLVMWAMPVEQIVLMFDQFYAGTGLLQAPLGDLLYSLEHPPQGESE